MNKTIKLKYLVDIPVCTGASKEAQDYDETKMRYIRISDFDQEGKIREENKVSIDYIDGEKYLLADGDILVAVTGGTVGKSIIFKNSEGEDSCYAGYLARIRTGEKLNNKFLYYFMNSPVYDGFKVKNMTKSTMENISASKYANMDVIYYDVKIQNKIVNILDKKINTIKSLIENEEEQINELQEYKQSLITKYVTKGLNNIELIDSNVESIGFIPKHWNLMRAKYVFNSILKGNGITKDEVFEDGDVECVRYGEIYTKYEFSFDKCASKTKSEIISNKVYFEYGDILFSGTGELVEEIGKNIVYLGKNKCLAGGDIIIAKHNQDPEFLNYALCCQASQIQKSKGKSKLKVVHISAQNIGNIMVALPPIEEQKQISKFLNNKISIINEIISLKRKKIDELKEYKKSLIYEYITGKHEVKEG